MFVGMFVSDRYSGLSATSLCWTWLSPWTYPNLITGCSPHLFNMYFLTITIFASLLRLGLILSLSLSPKYCPENEDKHSFIWTFKPIRSKNYTKTKLKQLRLNGFYSFFTAADRFLYVQPCSAVLHWDRAPHPSSPSRSAADSVKEPTQKDTYWTSLSSLNDFDTVAWR